MHFRLRRCSQGRGEANAVDKPAHRNFDQAEQEGRPIYGRQEERQEIPQGEAVKKFKGGEAVGKVAITASAITLALLSVWVIGLRRGEWAAADRRQSRGSRAQRAPLQVAKDAGDLQRRAFFRPQCETQVAMLLPRFIDSSRRGGAPALNNLELGTSSLRHGWGSRKCDRSIHKIGNSHHIIACAGEDHGVPKKHHL